MRNDTAVTNTARIPARTNSFIAIMTLANFWVRYPLRVVLAGCASKPAGSGPALSSIVDPGSSFKIAIAGACDSSRRNLAVLVSWEGENADWENHHVYAIEIEPPFQSKRRLVVKEATKKSLPLKNQLSGEEHRPREIACYRLAELL